MNALFEGRAVCFVVAALAIGVSVCGGTGDDGSMGTNGDSTGPTSSGTGSGSTNGTGSGSTNGTSSASVGGTADTTGGSGGLDESGSSDDTQGPDPRCADAEPTSLTGAGTQGDPYLLCLPEQLRLLDSDAYPLTQSYALGDDLDVSSLDPALPTIGEGTNPLTGVFDGGGWSIHGLTATLFERVEATGEVMSVRLFGDVDATMQSLSWGLLTTRNLGTVRDVHVAGTFGMPSHGGMLVGTNEGLIEYCAASGIISEGGNHIGGLVGVNLGTIRRSWSTASVTGFRRVGGLVGSQSASPTPGRIEESYATGAITGVGSVGGLLGTLFAGEIENSFARGGLVAGDAAGGLVGEQSGAGTISHCYAASPLDGSDAGGLVSEVHDDGLTVTNSYFHDAAMGTIGTALSSDQMMMESSFSGWDFATVWKFDTAISAYPSLHFQQAP